MIEGMNEDLFFSNSAGIQSHYMHKLLAIESLIQRQCCTEPCGLYKALRAVQSLTGCTEPYGLYEATAAFSVG
jgi:hypothetical protein